MTMATVTPHQSHIHFNNGNQEQQQQQKQLNRSRSLQYEASRSHRTHTQQIGNYVIYKKTLGSGSMGTVKLAECLSDKDHQQVKALWQFKNPVIDSFFFLYSMQSRSCPRLT
jgi:hypothetical protein